MNKIGIFGGTFDPIHHGHLILARDAVEQLGLESILFIPAAISPHKLGKQTTDPIVRLEMLRAAIEGEERFRLNTIELDRLPPSYTIDTIEALRERQPGVEFVYLIGEDNVAALPTWHRFDELSKMVQFAVLERVDATPSSRPSSHAAGAPRLRIRRHLDISATDIRNRVARDESIRYLVPPAVEKLIHERKLYREP